MGVWELVINTLPNLAFAAISVWVLLQMVNKSHERAEKQTTEFKEFVETHIKENTEAQREHTQMIDKMQRNLEKHDNQVNVALEKVSDAHHNIAGALNTNSQLISQVFQIKMDDILTEAAERKYKRNPQSYGQQN